MTLALPSNLAVLDLNDLGAPVESVPLPEAVIEGSPLFTTWRMNSTSDGRVCAGVWNSTPGAWHSRRDGTWEYCTLIAGVIEIAETHGPTRRFCAGDSFVMEPGFEGTWRVLEEVRKIWVSYT